MGFFLQKAKCRLRKCISERIRDSEGESERLRNSLALIIEHGAGSKDAFQHFFPAYDAVELAVAGDEGHSGVDMSASRQIPDSTFMIYDPATSSQIFSLPSTRLKGKAKLKTNTLGESYLQIDLATQVPREDMSKLMDYLDADLEVSAAQMQPDLFDGDDEPEDDGSDETGTVADIDYMGDAEDAGDNGYRADTNDSESITGREMKAAREAKDWTRADLSRAMGVSPKDISAYERGDKLMSPQVQLKATAALR